jgi:hypothetical protein
VPQLSSLIDLAVPQAGGYELLSRRLTSYPVFYLLERTNARNRRESDASARFLRLLKWSFIAGRLYEQLCNDQGFLEQVARPPEMLLSRDPQGRDGRGSVALAHPTYPAHCAFVA